MYMPSLIRETENGWLVDPSMPEIVWQTADAWQAGQPLLLTGDAEPDRAYLAASAIAIEFPALTDGRGLSLAVLLRTRLQYTGELRAVGAVHEDLLHYMTRCGFNSFELSDERDVDTALDLLKPYADHYQASVNQPVPAFRRVNRGRSA
jgi:uncharacterized protein (DUF934 family)